MAKAALGLATLGVGILALGLAVLPPIALGLPPPWWGGREEPAREKVIGRKSIEWRGIKITWGGKRVREGPGENEGRLRLARGFRLATVAVSLVGLMLGPLAWWRERRYGLAVPGMAFSCLALTWEYVILGIAVGFGAAVFLLLLAAFANGI